MRSLLGSARGHGPSQPFSTRSSAAAPRSNEWRMILGEASLPKPLLVSDFATAQNSACPGAIAPVRVPSVAVVIAIVHDDAEPQPVQVALAAGHQPIGD